MIIFTTSFYNLLNWQKPGEDDKLIYYLWPILSRSLVTSKWRLWCWSGIVVVTRCSPCVGVTPNSNHTLVTGDRRHTCCWCFDVVISVLSQLTGFPFSCRCPCLTNNGFSFHCLQVTLSHNGCSLNINTLRHNRPSTGWRPWCLNNPVIGSL